MKKILITSTIIMLLGVSYQYGRTLADCKTVANLFRNTCTTAPDSAATWDSSFTSTTVTCTDMDGCPSGYGTAPNCAWPRKLCVSCTSESDTVYMRIQTNGMPDHCYGGAPTVAITTVDIKFKFNNDVSSATKKTFSSQSDFDNTACKPQKAQSIPTTAGFTNLGDSDNPNLDGIQGIAINGVLMFASASASQVDPYYPGSWSGAISVQSETVDACIGHPDGEGIYHYHMLPPCLVNADNMEDTEMCTIVSECSSDLKGYALDNYSSYKTFKILGMAKDGHFLVGPYQDDGTEWNCGEADQCNGRYFSDGSYGYVYSNVYPYGINCFGPAQDLTYTASCTTNACTSSNSFILFLDSIVLSFILALTLINI